MKDDFIKYICDNWTELVGALISFIYIYLSIKQKMSLWLFGFLSSVFYIVVFYKTKFYADMSLQFYYLGASIYGWIHWEKGSAGSDELPVQRLTLKKSVYFAAVTMVIFLVYFLILSKYTDSTIPKADALVGALSIVGTWMLARKLLENWIVWVVADALSTGLFIYKHMYPTTCLFFVYTLMSVAGFIQWRKSVGEGITR